jgi:hypothetical protein
MGEKEMIAAVQAALDHHGIDDTVVDVGQFEPRGTTGALFAGGFAGDAVGDALGGGAEILGGAVGSLAGIHAAGAAQGLPLHVMVGASAKAVYGFAMAAGGRRHEPHDLLFAVPRSALEIKVHGRVNVRTLELINEETGSKIELEGNRLPITHSHDLIRYLAGDDAAQQADAEAGDA